MKRNRMVLVEFADSNIGHGWEHPEATQDGLALVRAVGYLKSEDDEQLTLTMALSDLGLIFEKFTIPKASVKSVKELRVK